MILTACLALMLLESFSYGSDVHHSSQLTAKNVNPHGHHGKSISVPDPKTKPSRMMRGNSPNFMGEQLSFVYDLYDSKGGSFMVNTDINRK